METFGTESYLTKVALFDLDHTIIEPKSLTKAGTRRILPIDDDDWTFKEGILEKLHSLKKKYKIVIVSNQTHSIKKKIESILEKLDYVFVIVAIGHSNMRKPCTGSWDLLKYKQLEGSFYVGDALGREGDFSDTDYKFALNLKIPVYEPESFFKSMNFPEPFSGKIPEHPLTKYITNSPIIVDPSEEQEILILVGAPASGKSRFANEFVKRHPNYVIISNDISKTTSKQLTTLLNKGHSLIIDNTNPTELTRSSYTFKNKRTIFFDFPKEVVMHLNTYRSLTSSKKVSEIAIHKYYKTLERPSECFVIDKIVKDGDDNLLMSYLM